MCLVSRRKKTKIAEDERKEKENIVQRCCRDKRMATLHRSFLFFFQYIVHTAVLSQWFPERKVALDRVVAILRTVMEAYREEQRSGQRAISFNYKITKNSCL